MIKSCAQCRYSLKETEWELGAPLFCFNPQCSTNGKRYWTPCSYARHIEFGNCTPDALYFKAKVETV